MKIGVFTFHSAHNYGAILQSYALQKKLASMGHEPFLINISEIYWRLRLYIKRFIFKYILRKKGARDVFFEKELRELSQKPQRFINENLQIKDISYVKKNKNNLDAIIVGSDQIWRSTYFPNIERAYLSFAQGWSIKRIAYAPSFGTDKWEYTKRQTRNCKRLLNLFNAVSVREESGIELCEKYFGRKVVQVLDPTLLLDVQDYISLFKKVNANESKGDLLVYFLELTEEKNNIKNVVASFKDLVPFEVNSAIKNVSLPFSERIAPPLENWLRGFYDAKFVITDSFHACAFSIMFHKPFLVYGTRSMSRFDSLLNLFNLDNRKISK